MKNKDPKHREAIKKLQDKHRKMGTPQFGDEIKKKNKKADPIAHAHKQSSSSPKSMFKSSMKHLNHLLEKKK